ncbi:MAG TPA: hypothetical protein VIV83_01370 [Gemmatimonadales bacterium]|jgi:hypothetical protein
MKRIALAVALVVMAAGACKKAQNNAADSTRADTTHMMADSMKMAAPDTAKMRADSVRRADSMKAATKAPVRRPTRRP